MFCFVTIVHQRYLIYYGNESWVQGYWKNLIENPPCKKPGEAKNKQFSYEFLTEINPMTKRKEIYLDLVGDDTDLQEIERQLSKFKLCRIVDEKKKYLSLIVQAGNDSLNTVNYFYEFCRDNSFKIISKEVHPIKSR